MWVEKEEEVWVEKEDEEVWVEKEDEEGVGREGGRGRCG